MEAKIIRLRSEGRDALAGLAGRLPALREAALARAPGLETRLDRTRRGLDTLQSLESRYGDRPIDLEGVEELVAALITDLAHVETEARRAGDAALLGTVSDFVIGAAVWALRHAVPVAAPEPVVNALAFRADGTRDKEALAAACGLMRALAENLAPRLGADLERSNPERPWRILHANLAITAIRTERPELMDATFDAFEAALPDERAGFFAEALALALAPGIAPAVRERIEARHLKWTGAR